VQMWKNINGVEVLMYDSGADSFGGNVLTWPKSPVEGTQVTLRYRPQGSSGAWTTLTTASGIETRGSVYWVGLGALSAGQYQYELSYTRSGESVPYAQGSGTFALNTAKATGSENITAVVDKPFLDIDTTSAVLTSYASGYDTVYVWNGINRINLQWQSLETLGDGNVRVAVNYTKKNANGQTQAATWNQTFAAADAVRGTELIWSASNSSVSLYSYEGLNGVSRVQMWKTINGVEVLMYDSGADLNAPLL